MFLALAPLLLAALPQGDGVTLMSQKDEYDAYNDVWGYTAPDGREYAILGTNTGTAIYNCSNPSAPYLTGFIPGAFSAWRDMVTWGAYCYVVTEGGPGVQVISLANPESPLLVNTAATGLVGHSHTIACDQGTGRLYCNGTPAGVRVLDAALNPTDPPLVATFTAAYVHDCFVQHGMAHLAEIYTGRYQIVDVSNLPSFPLIASRFTPGNFTHNTWVNENDTLCATTDENDGGDVTLYDISNPVSPVQKSRISPFGATAHNAYLKGGIAYVSSYTAGFTYWDVANPAAPVYLGRYDTSASTGSFTAGDWSVYPFTANGMVYASDINNGLFVMRPDGKTVDVVHAALGDTADENGPYLVNADLVPVSGANPVVSAQVVWNADDGADQFLVMNPTGGNAWSAVLPGRPSPSVLQYRIEATCANGAVQRLPRSGWLRFHVGQRAVIYASGFEEATDAGWTHGSTAVGDDWERGDPVGNSDDPADAASGLNCWGNDLGLGGTNGKVLVGSSSWLQSPPIDCSTSAGTRLAFARWLGALSSSQESARLLVNGVVVWENDAHYQHDDRWIVQDFDISALADGQPAVLVRFEFDSRMGLSSGGWNVDDFEIYALRRTGTDAIALSGPATAAPGQALQYAITGAPAAASCWLLAATRLGATARYGANFDLADPVSLVATGAANAAGAAQLGLNVPANAAGRSVFLEAAARAGGGPMLESNFIRLAVQ